MKSLCAEDVWSMSKGKVAGDDGRAASVSVRDTSNSSSAPSATAARSQFVDDQQLVGGKLALETQQPLLIARLDQRCTMAAAAVKPPTAPSGRRRAAARERCGLLPVPESCQGDDVLWRLMYRSVVSA